jgi:hypothetical protein
MNKAIKFNVFNTAKQICIKKSPQQCSSCKTIPLTVGMGNALFVWIVKKTSARTVLQVGQKLDLSKTNTTTL